MNNTSIFTYLIGIVLIFNTMSLSVMNNENAVFNIPYTTSFRTDKINAALGCGHNIVFGNYLYPAGSRDALSLYMNPHFYGGTTVRCQFKTLFAKAFGTGQDYSELKSPETVAGQIKRTVGAKIKNVIVEWKKDMQGDNLQNSQRFLNELISQLQSSGMTVYLKAPASYFCRDVKGKPYILGVQKVKNFIIQMYGEEVHQYKDSHQIFLSEESEKQANYPNPKCPKFPSYKQLIVNFKNLNFFIEKTLQHQEAGYLGNEFEKILEDNSQLYSQIVFFDAYPPSLIKI